MAKYLQSTVLGLLLLSPLTYASVEPGINVEPLLYHETQCHSFVTIPAPTLGADRGRKIINITPSTENNSIYELQELTPSEVGDKYKVQDAASFVLGFSVTDATVIPGMIQFLPFLGKLFGILPMIGTNSSSERFVDSEEEAENLPKATIPKHPEEIDIWSVNDYVQYAIEGGISLFTGVDGVAASLIFPLIVQGEWGITVKKLDEHHVLLAVERLKAIGVRAQAGNFFFKAAATYLKDVKKIYAFKIDLRDEDARKTYPTFFRGNLKKLQNAVANSKPWIEEVIALRETHTQKAIKFRACIPLIVSATWEADYGDKESGLLNGDPQYIEKSEDICTDFSCLRNVFKKSNRHRHYKHVHKATKITARMYKNLDKGLLQGAENELDMVWEYRNDGANIQSFEKAMNKLYRFTTMKDFLEKKWNLTENPIYFGIEFKVHTDGKKLKKLANHSKFTGVEMILKAHRYLDSYFFTEKDPEGLCKETLFQSTDECIYQFRERTNDAVIALQEKVAAYKEHSDSKDDSEVLSQLLSIGNLIFKTPFVMRAALESAQGHLELQYKLEGQKFKPFILSLTRHPE